MSRLIVAAITLLAAIVGLLGAAAWNRGGEVQTMTLTERELHLPPTWENGRDDDDAELRLSLVWVRRDDPLDARAWLTDDRLARLGFAALAPATAPEAERFYARSVSRLGWVALEFDGPSWRALDARRETSPTVDASPWTGVDSSRLVPIDAALDRTTLLDRHRGESVLIVPAVFTLRRTQQSGGAIVWGRLDSLVSPAVSVPVGLRERLRGLSRPTLAPRRDATVTVGPATIPARYEVDLAIGRLGAPWIVDVRRR